MCENGIEITAYTQTRALSDQPHCLFAPSYTQYIGQRGNNFDCRVDDVTEHKILRQKILYKLRYFRNKDFKIFFVITFS